MAATVEFVNAILMGEILIRQRADACRHLSDRFSSIAHSMMSSHPYFKQ
jgi:hypothetical protein